MSRSKARPSRPIPRSMDNSLQSIGEKSGYSRKRAPSFFYAIEAATGKGDERRVFSLVSSDSQARNVERELMRT